MKKKIASQEEELGRAKGDRGNVNVSPKAPLPSTQYSGSPPVKSRKK